MTFLARRKKQLEAVTAREEELEDMKRATADLEERVRRLEQDSKVFVLAQKRELRQRGMCC